MRIILASKSPRRKACLEMLGMEFEVIPSNVDERSVQESDPIRLARKLARMKAENVASNIEGGAIVIGADTLVSFQGRAIGKARDKEYAFHILRGYSGKEHEQITGICIINTMTGKVVEDHDVTRVLVRKLSDPEIRKYVETGEPMEGAGCYTPRAHSMLFERIDGSWANMVGFPVEKFVPILGRLLGDSFI